MRSIPCLHHEVANLFPEGILIKFLALEEDVACEERVHLGGRRLVEPTEEVEDVALDKGTRQMLIPHGAKAVLGRLTLDAEPLCDAVTCDAHEIDIRCWIHGTTPRLAVGLENGIVPIRVRKV